MDVPWKLTDFFLGLVLIGLCSGFPIGLENSAADYHTQLLTGLVGVLLTVCGIVFLAGCLCCHRRNGFKEFQNNAVVASSSSSLDHGLVNPISTAGEFTIFTPLSPSHHNNNVFLANEQLVGAHEINQADITSQLWFDGTEKDFPRTKLKYIKEIGKGWFGRVVQGTAEGLNNDDAKEKRTSVIVRILEASASSNERTVFLNDANIYLCGKHPHVLQLLGRCLESVPLLLLQEFSYNGDLKKYLRNNVNNAEKLLFSDLPLRWCCQLTSALKHLHEYGVAHSDLAARNCQIVADLNLKLGDYGLSVESYPEDYYQGTPAVPVRWCAPESLTCTSTTIQPKQFTFESNVWSLGVTIWEIYSCGTQPYSNFSDDDVIFQVLGAASVRLQRPNYSLLYSDYIYRIMQLCWSTCESRPSVGQVHLMLTDLLEVYKNMKNETHRAPQISLEDFDKRWESFKPNSVIKTDNHQFDTSSDSKDVEFVDKKLMSPSLNNLHGSLDNLATVEMDSWLQKEATRTGDMSYVLGLSEAIQDLDNALALENVSSSDSSHQPSPAPESILATKQKLDFKLGASNNFNDLINIPSCSLTESMQHTSSGSETEDENWRKKIELGVYSEKVHQKSKSVADLMILTHIDCSESDTETPLPSLDYRINNYKNVRYAPKQNLENISLMFGSEGNLLSVHDKFQKELKKLQEERKDSLLFVPEYNNLKDDETVNDSRLQNLFSFEETGVASETGIPLSSSVNTSPSKETPNETVAISQQSPKKLIEELSSPTDIQPVNQVYNVFNVTVDSNFSPIKHNLNNIICYKEESEDEDKLELSAKYFKVPKLSDLIQNNDDLMDYIIAKYESQDEENLQIKTEDLGTANVELDNTNKELNNNTTTENSAESESVIANSAEKDADSDSLIHFDVGVNQEEVLPSSMTHSVLFSSTPHVKRTYVCDNSTELIPFSSNFNEPNEEIPDVDLNYSLETWDNFLGKTFDASREFSSEPQSLLFSVNETVIHVEENCENRSVDNLLDEENDKKQCLDEERKDGEDNHTFVLPQNENDTYSANKTDFCEDAFICESKTYKCDEENQTHNCEEENQTYNCEEEIQTDNCEEEIQTDNCEEEIQTDNCVEDNKTYICEEDNKTYICEEDNKTYICEEDNKTYICEEDNKTYVCEDNEENSDETISNNKWETGEGWFLHPQANLDVTGEIDATQSEEPETYSRFGIDDEVMTAIRNELLLKLPQAQGQSNEQVRDSDDWNSEGRNEVHIKYNLYTTPLSPIPEESYSENSQHFICNREDSSDSENCDWPDPYEERKSSTETPQSLQNNDNPVEEPHTRHTPSQDSCCSNDTLFNLEELSSAISEGERNILKNGCEVAENLQLNKTFKVTEESKDTDDANNEAGNEGKLDKDNFNSTIILEKTLLHEEDDINKTLVIQDNLVNSTNSDEVVQHKDVKSEVDEPEIHMELVESNNLDELESSNDEKLTKLKNDISTEELVWIKLLLNDMINTVVKESNNCNSTHDTISSDAMLNSLEQTVSNETEKYLCKSKALTLFGDNLEQVSAQLGSNIENAVKCDTNKANHPDNEEGLYALPITNEEVAATDNKLKDVTLIVENNPHYITEFLNSERRNNPSTFNSEASVECNNANEVDYVNCRKIEDNSIEVDYVNCIPLEESNNTQVDYVNVNCAQLDDGSYEKVEDSNNSEVDYVNSVQHDDGSYEKVENSNNSEVDYVNSVQHDDGSYEKVEDSNNSEVDYVNCVQHNDTANLEVDDEIDELYECVNSPCEPEADIYDALTDIRFNGPCDMQLMSTSFSESVDIDEQDWDSGSDTRSSSSGEFIWKEGEHEESVKALRAAPQDIDVDKVNQMEQLNEVSTDSSDEDDEGDSPEFVPSAWDKYATPTKSALRSPEKTLEKCDEKHKKSKGVWFKKQKYHCVYEYPREPESPSVNIYDLWKPLSATMIDWNVDSYNMNQSNTNSATSLYQPNQNLYHLPELQTGMNKLDDEFYITSSTRPFQSMGEGVSSQFFPGQSVSDQWTNFTKRSNENVTPDSGVEDITPAGNGEDLVQISYVKPLKILAAAVLKRNQTNELKTNNKDSPLGGLRHARNRLKLDLPPSPSAFTSSKSFVIDSPVEPITKREVPTFTTFGKSRFVVQQVDTPTLDDKNVSFEALPYKPRIMAVKKDKVEIVRGEASLLDSADEDSGIESSTLERHKVTSLSD